LRRQGGAAKHRLVTIDLAAFGGSALTDAGIAVPKDREAIADESGNGTVSGTFFGDVAFFPAFGQAANL
jgi:hypothetical protein